MKMPKTYLRYADLQFLLQYLYEIMMHLRQVTIFMFQSLYTTS
jgi:hypothetical protein